MKQFLKKSKPQLLCSFVVFITFSFTALAQSASVKGIVVSGDDGMPIPGVNVIIKGTNLGTTTDFDGAYELFSVPAEAILSFEYVGMDTQEVLVKEAVHNIVLKSSVTGLDEVVVVGYGTMKKREVTGAIASVKSKEITKVATSDFASAIQGRIAGVNVKQGTGAPGESAVVTIRGITSFQEGGSGPLYVVDGVTYLENPNITPQEIESIEVLKDGASAAIYGSRASGGVILITTKGGKEGQMKVSLDSYYGIQNITSSVPLANTLDALYINDVMYRTEETKFDPLEFNKDALEYNTDWKGFVENNNAAIQNHSLNISGGSNGLTYSVIGTYFDQDGTVINSGYKKYSLRSNTGYKKGKFNAQTTLSINRGDQMRSPWAVMYDAIKLQPYRAPVDPNTENMEIGGTNPENISSFAGKLMEENTVVSNSYNGNLRLSYELAKGLKANVNLGGSFYNTKNRWFKPSYNVYGGDGNLNIGASNLNAQLRYTDGTNFRGIGEFTLNYKTKYKNHNFDILVGNTYESSKYESHRYGANYITSNLAPSLGNGEPVPGQQRITQTNSISYLGRLNYNYKWKYILSLVVRNDGSSNFGKDYRYGTFPSLSAAWNIAGEDFFKGIKDEISAAKLRVGVGTTGSDRIPPFSYNPLVISNVDYPFGIDNSLTPGMTQPGFADPNLKWETNQSKNIGLDLEFRKGKAGLNIDVYEQDKKDMLLAIVAPISVGSTPVNGENYDTYLTNIGNLRNRGVEIAGHFNQRIGDLNLKFSGTFTKNENKVISLSQPGEVIYGGYPNVVRQDKTEPVAVFEAGLPVGAFKVYETNGVIKTDEELVEYQKLNPTAQKGDLRYVDTNGDGELSIEDRVYKGSYQPNFEYGFNVDATYKGFDLSVQLYGVEGNTIYNGVKQYAYSLKRHQDLVYAWSEANPTSNIPTPRTNAEHQNVQTSTDLFLEDGSYLRVRNIVFGYSLNEKVVKRLNAQKLRFYFSAQNPFTFTNYTGYNPDIGSNNPFDGGLDKGETPVSAIYSLGLSLSF